MSRDLKPYEMYSLSLSVDPDFHFLNTVWKLKDQEIPMYSEGEKEIIKSYQYFGRTAPSLLLKLYEAFADNGKLEELKKVEKRLEEYIETGNQEADLVLVQWFQGTLAPGYYREENDEAFFEYEMLQLDKAMEKEKTSLEEQILNASGKKVKGVSAQGKQKNKETEISHDMEK